MKILLCHAKRGFSPRYFSSELISVPIGGKQFAIHSVEEGIQAGSLLFIHANDVQAEDFGAAPGVQLPQERDVVTAVGQIHAISVPPILITSQEGRGIWKQSPSGRKAYYFDSIGQIVERLREDPSARPEDAERWIQRVGSEETYGLRLFCEAWLLKNWATGRDYPEMNEITARLNLRPGENPASLPLFDELHAPASLDEWLKPFGTLDELLSKLPQAVTSTAKQFFDAEQTFASVAALFTTLHKYGGAAE